MSIKRGGDNVIPHRDSWINIDSQFTYGICTGPRKFSHVAGTRCYYYSDPDGYSDKTQYCYLKSVRFICDTYAESGALYAVSCSQLEKCNEAIDEVCEAHGALISDLMLGKKVILNAKPAPKPVPVAGVKRRMRLRGQS